MYENMLEYTERKINVKKFGFLRFLDGSEYQFFDEYY